MIKLNLEELRNNAAALLGNEVFDSNDVFYIRVQDPKAILTLIECVKRMKEALEEHQHHPILMSAVAFVEERLKWPD